MWVYIDLFLVYIFLRICSDLWTPGIEKQRKLRSASPVIVNTPIAFAVSGRLTHCIHSSLSSHGVPSPLPGPFHGQGLVCHPGHQGPFPLAYRSVPSALPPLGFHVCPLQPCCPTSHSKPSHARVWAGTSLVCLSPRPAPSPAQ